MSPKTIVPRGQRLELFPEMTRFEVERRRYTNALLDSWDACRAAHGAANDLHRRIEKIEAKLADPAFADIPADDPRRIEGEQRLKTLRRSLDEAINAGPTAKTRGGLKHRLACFSGLLSSCREPSLVAMHVSSFGERKNDIDRALLESVYRNPDLVEGQEFWPEIIASFEEAFEGERNDCWAELRRWEGGAREGLSETGRILNDREWRNEWRKQKQSRKRLDAVPF